MGSNKKARVVLQFNEMDFRHRRALDILRQRPRSMSELVVNAILHYTSCPEAANEFGRDWVVSIEKRKTIDYSPPIEVWDSYLKSRQMKNGLRYVSYRRPFAFVPFQYGKYHNAHF